MKIRIKGNSIRFRLTKTEVDNFGSVGVLNEKTEFGNNEFIYSLQSTISVNEMSAKLEGNKITMFIPEAIKEEWVKTNIVGFDHKMPIGNGKDLFLLVEKDFVCLDNTFEDQSDNYPNPNAVC